MNKFILLLYLVLVTGFTRKQLEAGKACTRLVGDLVTNNYDLVKQEAQKQPSLDSKNLENKLLSDVIDFCVERISEDQVTQVKESRGNYSWEQYKSLLVLDSSKYTSEEDLVVSENHKQLRKALLQAEKGPKLSEDPQKLKRILDLDSIKQDL